MSQITRPIFIVDDDDSTRTSLRRLLLSVGCSTETFASASSFLDSVPMELEGTLILDIHMPNMDGLQLQDKLRQFRSPLKIIFITAHASPGDREKALANGAIGFLIKPFNDQSLLDLVLKSQNGK